MSEVGSRRGIAVAGAAFLVLVLLSPGAAAVAAPPQVLVCPERTGYASGEIVNLTVYTLRGGFLADVDSINVRWGVDVPAWSVNVTRAAIGTYRGSFVMNLTNPSWHAQGLFLQAEVVYADGTGGFGMQSMELLPSRRLDVTLTPSTYRIRPGDTLRVAIQVSEGGLAVDATNLSVTVMAIGWGFEFSTTEVASSRIGVGLYELDYVVPADFDGPWLQVSAAAFVDNATVWGSVPISILGSHPFDLWTHVIEAQRTYLRFEILVSREAVAVPGATVDFAYVGMGSYLDNPDTGTLAAVTDAHGRAAFNLSHSFELVNAYIEGNVTYGALHQGFATFVSGQGPPPPNPPGAFEVRRANPWELVGPNTSALLRYRAFRLGQPLARAWIEYSVSSPFSLLASGQVETDDGGNFGIVTPVPPTAVEVAFFSNMTGGWLSWTDRLSPGYLLSVTADPMQSGAVSHVSGTLPTTGGPWALFASLLPLDAAGTSVDWTWQPATLGQYLPDDVALGTALLANQSFPSFLPKGRDYVRSVVLQPLVLPDTGFVRWVPTWAFAEVVSIPNAPPTARFTVSTTTPAAGEPVWVNASASSDDDGWVDAYQIDWGDGDWTNWAPGTTYSHTYRVGRDFVLTVHVRDDSGAYNASSVALQVAPAILGVRLAFLLAIAGLLAAVAVIGVAWILRVRWMRRTEEPPGPDASLPRETESPPDAPPVEKPPPPRRE